MNGFSGSRLQVYTCENHPYGSYRVVRKEIAADSAEARVKLVVEIEKTEILRKYAEPNLYRVPCILNRNSTWYDRTFIIGATLEDHLLGKSAKEVESWAHRIQQVLVHWRTLPLPARHEPQVFVRYLDALWDKAVRTMSPGKLMNQYRELVHQLRSQLYPIPAAGFCHGDLALDNLLVDPDGQLWIIDPLYNVYETSFWDIGKLLQSTMANWMALRQGRLEDPPASLQNWADALLNEDRKTGLFFALVVLLRIVRHAPGPDQKEALMKRIIQVGEDYLR